MQVSLGNQQRSHVEREYRLCRPFINIVMSKFSHVNVIMTLLTFFIAPLLVTRLIPRGVNHLP